MEKKMIIVVVSCMYGAWGWAAYSTPRTIFSGVQEERLSCTGSFSYWVRTKSEALLGCTIKTPVFETDKLFLENYKTVGCDLRTIKEKGGLFFNTTTYGILQQEYDTVLKKYTSEYVTCKNSMRLTPLGKTTITLISLGLVMKGLGGLRGVSTLQVPYAI